MPTYRGTADRPDRAKAIAAVAAVHIALAVMIISGLNVRMVQRTISELTTIDIREPPPPSAPEKPAPKPDKAKERAGPPAKQADPAPVVAPQAPLPASTPIPAAKVAGAGSSSSSGSALGNGTGAGGTGNGAGGGGSGDFSRFTPARLVRNLNRSDYHALAAGRIPAGRAMVSLRIEPTGQPTNCRVLRSSGDPYVDANLCPLVTQRLRFRPALDDQGRPIPFQLDYVATWAL